jgi:hypothetical protein
MQRLLAGSVEPRTISIVVCESGNCSQNLRRHSMKLSVPDLVQSTYQQLIMRHRGCLTYLP